jgi:phosphomannomutase
MKEVEAIVGGEGSGGVIFPELHYGRDALVGIALTLQHLTDFGKSLSELKNELPQYFISKKKIKITSNPDIIIQNLRKQFSNQKLNTDDGLRIDFDDHWVHFRKSNTEPIIRIIVEAKNESEAISLSEKYMEMIKQG